MTSVSKMEGGYGSFLRCTTTMSFYQWYALPGVLLPLDPAGLTCQKLVKDLIPS